MLMDKTGQEQEQEEEHEPTCNLRRDGETRCFGRMSISCLYVNSHLSDDYTIILLVHFVPQ